MLPFWQSVVCIDQYSVYIGLPERSSSPKATVAKGVETESKNLYLRAVLGGIPFHLIPPLTVTSSIILYVVYPRIQQLGPVPSQRVTFRSDGVTSFVIT